MRVLIAGGLSDGKFYSKTCPIVFNENIEKVYILRSFGNIYRNVPSVSIAPVPYFLLKSHKGLKRIIFDVWNLIYYSLLLIIGRIDIIVGIYLYPYGYYAAFLSKISKKPFILVLPGTDLKILLETKKCLKEFKRASYFAVRGNNSQKNLKGLGINERKIFILQNVFEMDNYKVKKSTPKKYHIVYVGYLRKLKRLDRFIKIISILKNDFPDICCAIVGSGPEKKNLIDQVSTLKLKNNIKFIPHNDNIEEILCRSKLMLLTSDSEGLPMTLIEAMSCGLPVVTSKINDIPDVVEHGKNGFLCSPNNIDEFVHGCKVLLHNEDTLKKMSMNARQSIEKKYKTDFSFIAQKELWYKYLVSMIKREKRKKI